MILWWVAGIILAMLWTSRLLAAAFGMRQLADLTRPQWQQAPPSGPGVSVIVPARNEQQGIEAGLRSLLALDYQNYEIIAVNDRSTDATGEIMTQLAEDAPEKLKVLHIENLPGGWLGKPHAMWRAAQQASADWLLFTDADVVFHRDALARSMAYAQQSGCDHLVLFPTMIMRGVWERTIIGFFQCFFLFGYRPWKAPDPRARDFLGVGAFNLIRRQAYERLGTFAALHMEVIEDMKLGKLVKQHGFTQRAAVGRDLVRIRWAQGGLGVIRNLTKNFFAFMHFQWWRALGACLGVGFVALGPYVGLALAPGWAKISFAVALLAIFLVYVGMSRQCDIPPYYFLLHAAGGVLFIYTILRSAAVTSWNDGISWRGTKYLLEDLKKGLV
jgi:glycosyltransferase involved in cell wall biosynthesis